MNPSKPFLPESLEGRGNTSDATRMESPELADVAGTRAVAEVALHLADPARTVTSQAVAPAAVDADEDVFHTGAPVVGLPAWFVQRMTPSRLKDVLGAVLNAMHFRRTRHAGKFHSVPLLPDPRASVDHKPDEEWQPAGMAEGRFHSPDTARKRAGKTR